MRTLQLLTLCALAAAALPLQAQELDARITVNHEKVQGTSTSIFESLQTNLTQFVNDRQWTSQQYQKNERISCSFAITVNSYNESENKLDCTLAVQSTRPVYNASYTTTVFSQNDRDFSFTYQEFDQLDFRPDVVDNELTAVIAYYVYLIIGMDLDTMAPLGGTEALQTALTITNNAQSLTSKGWKAFEDSRNRYALITDLLDGGMEPFRQMQYKYYREGMDIMAENADRGRAAITEAVGLLKQARENKSMSAWPQLFSEYKRDEIVNIYKGKGTAKEKEDIYETFSTINPSQRANWNKIKE